jgi:hypothetical protein
MQKLEEMVEHLPPDIYRQVQEYAEFLIAKRAKELPIKPEFNWAGALKDMSAHYSSVELQHQITEWRSG